MSLIRKRDGSTVLPRLKAEAKEKSLQRHREFLDRKMGRTDSVSLGEGQDASSKMWAEAAKKLGMEAKSDGQGGMVFSEPNGEQTMLLKSDKEGVLRWDFSETPAVPAESGDPKLVKDKDGVLRWVLPGEEAPAGAGTPVATDMWKQAGEALGMTVSTDPKGGLIFREK